MEEEDEPAPPPVVVEESDDDVFVEEDPGTNEETVNTGPEQPEDIAEPPGDG